MKDFFYYNYDTSKNAFLGTLPKINERWNNSSTQSYKVTNDDDNLTIDIITAKPNSKKNDKLLIITAGVHGIEAYLGNAMLHIFIEEYLDKLNPEDTGIAFVHSVNPWGMKNYRRVNENNIDLNRNFIWDWKKHDKHINKNYQHIKVTLNPTKPCSDIVSNYLEFVLGILKSIIKIGVKKFHHASKLGQYEYPKNLFYGGSSYEKSTQIMMKLYKELITDYKQIVSIDLHTGYGPVYQMSIINSPYEKQNVEQMKKDFSYPLIHKATEEDFYKIEGDLLNYLYKLIETKFKHKDLYAVGFEFGTKGENILNALSSLKILIDENRLFHYGCKSDKRETQIKESFLGLFYPDSPKWRDKAVQDFKQGIEGILRAKNYI